jgi:signal transduction histidine kinase
LGTGNVNVSTIWTADNTVTLDSLIASAPGLHSIKLKGADGKPRSFESAVSPMPADSGELVVLQLLPAAPPEAGPSQVDAGLAHKQKLDCALQLARTVALDFNNALTSILGHTSFVLSRLEPGNPWRNSLVEVEKSAAKAAEIANDLASFSRQEKEVKGQQSGNVNAVLQRNMEMFQANPPDKSKDVTWQLELERKLYAARFDEAKMQQAFLKIMENAVEALGTNGRIIVRTRNINLTEPTQDRNARLAAGVYVCAEITDNGSGIEADVLPRIFEPFFTTKRGGQHRGLGLVWVYGIVTNHGGAVAVSSTPGSGTSVRIYLPAEEKLVKDNGTTAGDLNGDQTILLVDDEDLLLTMGQTILSAYGYSVITANSGRKAIEILSKPETTVDLMLTDLVMPGMSGRELVEQVRKIAPGVRVLCSSGYVLPSATERGEINYLQKPFTSQELLSKVKSVLSEPDSPSVD